jgi:hypothetical protein
MKEKKDGIVTTTSGTYFSNFMFGIIISQEKKCSNLLSSNVLLVLICVRDVLKLSNV